MKFNKKRTHLSLTIICFCNMLYAQNFTRIELQSGLNLLRDNIGVAVADYDGDNDLDLFVVSKFRDVEGSSLESQLFRNNNDGTYTDVTEVAGLTNLHPYEESHTTDPFNNVSFTYQDYKWGVSWGDYDNDGDPDLFFTNAYRILLYANIGDGTFEDVTIDAGFENFNGCFNTSSVWFDYNNDGFLDIYIGDYSSSCGKNSFYVNNGNGTFTESSELFTNDGNGSKFNFATVPIDVNNDGYLDLYLANDFGRNDLYVNQNGTGFIEQSEAYNLDNTSTGMALSIGDYDNDGLFDMYLSNIDVNNLFKNMGNNSFVDTALQANVSSGKWAWDSRFSDFDLDGDEDLIVLNGYNNHIANNIYFENLLKQGQNLFSNISSEVNFNEFSFSLSSEVFDYDNDGDLEIFVTNKEGLAFFYDNKTIDLSQPDDKHWFKIKLEGTISNRDAIGTKISITTDNDTYHRYYHGASLYSQSLQPVHFGIGSDSEILELKISWPRGLTETYNDINIDQTLLVKEAQGYEILNIQPSVRIMGCMDPTSCNYNPLAVVDDGSCSYLTSMSISGSTNSSYLKTEIYSYPITDQEAQVNWDIEGGQIVETISNNSIRVKWGFRETGKVIAIESNGCSSLPSELEVILEVPDRDSFLNNNSVARLWNELLLEAIRDDLARPTVHARNLFHASVAMYDSWAIYDDDARPYLLGEELGNFIEDFNFIPNKDIEDSRNETISFAAYRLLNHRFRNSPGANESSDRFNLLIEALGYDSNNTSTDYSSGDPAALGNFIAEFIINYGHSDGARELTGYDNAYYNPANLALAPAQSGNQLMRNPNRWQPLSLDVFIDQSGNEIAGNTPEFLSPEWGNVTPFSLNKDFKSTFQRNDNNDFDSNYIVYHDPGAPPYIDIFNTTSSSDAYKWGFSLVSIWGSHLDPNDGVMWDISPGANGNNDINSFPRNYTGYPNFYNQFEGGDSSNGHSINPITNEAYEPYIVPRGDYTRVLAEFWADGPDSETPPGHWFTLLNNVNDHPMFNKKLGGSGEILDNLEWDVKAYFILGGAMHDVAIASWSIKGWYDYVRPISAIRYMVERGQSSDPSRGNYHVAGIPLVDGYIEIIEEGDSLGGGRGQHIGKIKLYTWKGHGFIGDTGTDQAGVGWIRAENWWPYQRPSFVTPPFAGYVSGHSTYSRAAAEVMTLLTGDAFFPGGYGEFIAKKDKFLVFENGPSVDVKLQWATYRDAADQSSLSRIWGGIHPPADDIPGRLIGETIGVDVYNYAIEYFSNSEGLDTTVEEISIYPNPVSSRVLMANNTKDTDSFLLHNILGNRIEIVDKNYDSNSKITTLKLPESLSLGIYILRINEKVNKKLIIE